MRFWGGVYRPKNKSDTNSVFVVIIASDEDHQQLFQLHAVVKSVGYFFAQYAVCVVDWVKDNGL